jgi:hypothetical protein
MSSSRAARSDVQPDAGPRVGNLILDYYERLRELVASAAPAVQPAGDADDFSPGFVLPELDEGIRRFFAVAEAGWSFLARHGSCDIYLLDLMRNPATNTTKTLPSLLIVARALEHVRRTGERVLIFSPTSANKGIALRDAVERAVLGGLVDAEQLRIATLAPATGRAKLRSSRLSSDPGLRRLNPVLVYDGPDPEQVKALGRRFVNDHARNGRAGRGANVWYTLELRNYVVADAARALFEHDVAPTAAAPPRLHAHAVSSAYGLLGYNLGRDLLESSGLASPADRPGFLLVQHLGAPDMVLSLHRGEFSRALVPGYTRSGANGLYEQDADPRFPALTYDPAEVLDPTFYTHEPATSPAMNELIHRFGGGGIVVSLYECLTRYPQLRSWFERSERPLPADFRTIREWSLVMALTGVTNAIDRGLVPSGGDVFVHGSGFYTTADYEPLDAAAITPVTTAEDIASAIRI